MKQEHINEIKAILILAVGIVVLASLVSFVPEDLPWHTSSPNIPPKNFIGITGACLAGTLLFIFGYSAYLLAAFLFFISWRRFAAKELRFSFYNFLGLVILFSVTSSFLGLLGGPTDVSRFQRGGLAGFLFSSCLVKYFNTQGAYTFLFILGTLAMILTGQFLLTPLLVNAMEAFKSLLGKVHQSLPAGPLTKAKTGVDLAREKFFKKAVESKQKREKAEAGGEGKGAVKTAALPVAATPSLLKPKIHITETPKEKMRPSEDTELQTTGEYHLPALDLLKDAPQIPTGKIQSSLMNGASLLEETLASFGVSARVADIERGPAITRYELEPAPGVKVQKITTLADDIALAMRASAIRIVAPIPGKNRVGIEVPNAASAAVFLKDVLTHSQFRSSESKLTLALGQDIAGKPMIADLAEMPHLLIAGTTGSGKTVCVNGIIMSMLFNASPEEVKFVMVDPKMVELSQYNDIPHLLCPTVTDAKAASAALNWVVKEMESRYTRLSKEGVRNIKGYNAKGHKMPYIVIIIDELADLMQVSAKTVESSITRLAQLSRAVGIHLILATQRPSVDVITGVIKANFPARISFKVASKVDSRTVLDMNGAENLLGKGDMLFIKPGDAKPTRGQCSYVKDEEIHDVIGFIKDQQKPVYDDTVTKQSIGGGPGGSEETDELFDEAVKLVIETNQASVSILQRRMRLGYTRAARLIDLMEQHGIVGPYCGSKPRDILVNREQWLIENMQKAQNG